MRILLDHMDIWPDARVEARLGPAPVAASGGLRVGNCGGQNLSAAVGPPHDTFSFIDPVTIQDFSIRAAASDGGASLMVRASNAVETGDVKVVFVMDEPYIASAKMRAAGRTAVAGAATVVDSGSAAIDATGGRRGIPHSVAALSGTEHYVVHGTVDSTGALKAFTPSVERDGVYRAFITMNGQVRAR